MKTSTVNVIQCNSGIIDEIQSFVDDAEGNKEAECLFTRILNEQEEDPTLEPDPTLEDPNAGIPSTPDASADPTLTTQEPTDALATEPTQTDDTSMDEVPMDSTEEIDITDLVNMTKSLKKDVENLCWAYPYFP